MANRANTVRPYDWIFYQWLKICTQHKPSPIRRRGTASAVDEVVELNWWRNGRTQFAPTIGFFVIVLKSAPQQMPSPTRRRGTAPAVDEVLGFNMRQKKGNPRRGFPSCTSCNSPILRKMAQRGVSLSAESDQRRRLWNPPPFEKGGPKLYLLVWNLSGGNISFLCPLLPSFFHIHQN